MCLQQEKGVAGIEKVPINGIKSAGNRYNRFRNLNSQFLQGKTNPAKKVPYSSNSENKVDFKYSMAYSGAMRMLPTSQEEERLAFAHRHLKELILRQMPEPGTFATGVPDVGMARRDVAGFSEHRFDRPLVSLLVQGSKETVIGSARYKLEPMEVLTVCVDMPSSSRILVASRQNPLLTFYFYINPHIIKELLLEMNNKPAPSQHSARVFVARAGVNFMETILQLATVIANGKDLYLKSRILLRYLHLIILTGENGHLVRNVYSQGTKSGAELFNAICFLRDNLDRGVSAKELSSAVNISESSLYRHFRDWIGISPLQYHKQLRLHKARELILAGGERIASIAYKVGYESVSQFSREYRKLFGQPPKKSSSQK